MAKLRGFMYAEAYRVASSTRPWGTPDETSENAESERVLD